MPRQPSIGHRASLGVQAPSPQPKPNRPTIALLVPVFNEAQAVGPFFEACDGAFTAADFIPHFLIINDGSTDSTRAVLDEVCQSRDDVTAIHLSRNFGKEAALSAAIDRVGTTADAVVPIDIDLQDPPEIVVEFVAMWRKGYDVVLGRRTDRSSDSRFKRWTAATFYGVINTISDTPVPSGVGDFRLMDRRVVEVVRALPERNRFMKGLFAWVGFTSTTVDYVRQARRDGTSSWNPWRLWNFALDGVTGFSSVPLRMWTYLGSLLAVGCLLFSAFIVALRLAGGIALGGYASLIVAVLFVGSVQLISLGLMGEYMARMMTEVKRRPVYVIDDVALPTGAVGQQEVSHGPEGGGDPR